MERKITASIADIELKEVIFKKKAKKQKLTYNMYYNYEISNNHVKYDCSFDFKLNTISIQSKYFYEVALYDLDEDEIEEFILSDEENVFLPLFSKMSGLIMKITDEVTPFPLVTDTDIWNIENKNQQ